MENSKEKQIDEMAKDICGLGRDCHGCTASMSYICKAKKYAERAYDKGYRKASEVAEEIFAEMREELVRYLMLNENIAIKCKEENGELNAEYWKGKLSAFKQIQGFIDVELKKKYIGKDTNVTTKESEKDNG